MTRNSVEHPEGRDRREIDEWLAGGGDLESYFEARALRDQNPNEVALLRRCALVRSFDAKLLKGPLGRNLPKDRPVHIPAFLRNPEISPSARQQGEYSLKQSARSRYLAWWAESEQTAGLYRFCRRMLEYYKQHGDALDIFGQRVFVAPDEACSQFVEWYRKADRKPDLAECESLLNLLRSYGELLQGPLVDALKDRERYFAGRVMFADDWTRTERFLERDEVTRRFAKFLDDPHKWIFHMHAPGGSGKTAYLRWLTARYCVVEKKRSYQRIPVAKIDMDFVRLASLDSAPWLILLPAADQLDRQIPGRPFASPMLTWLDKAPLLDRFTTGTAPVPVADEAETAACVADFVAALGDRRVVMILDTLEEMVLRHGQSLSSILQIFAQVRKRCPGFHVILSGRFDLRKRSETAEAMSSFRGKTVSLSVARFSRTEAQDYLRRVRGLRGNFALAAIVKGSERNPFKLALYADFAIARGSMTSKDVRDLGDVAHEYLIERIIERIPDAEMPLRWLLRYAVIPRPGFLTFEYLDRVLRRHLEREMRQQGLVLLDHAESSVWRPETGQFTLEQIWNRLLLYRSPSGWIDVVGCRPELQPEIIVPMRALLQREKIFCPLHADSADYFEKQGYKIEALYHRFWSEGPEARKYWETYLAEAPSLDAAEALASLICGGDLLGEDDRPLPHHVFGSVIGLDTVAEAAFELASISVRRHLLGPAKPSLLRKAQSYLRRAAEIEKWLDHEVIDSTRRALVEASLLDASGKGDQAITVTDLALAHAGVRTDAISLNVLKARLVESRDPEAAVGCLDEAARLVQQTRHPGFPFSWIRSRQGRLQFERDYLDRAAECYRQALLSLESRNGTATEIVSTLRTLVQLSRACFGFSEIPGWMARAERYSSEWPDARDFVSYQRARLSLDRGNLREAISFGDYGNTGGVPRSSARQRELWAESAWARHDYKSADGRFEEAFRFYKDDGAEDAMIDVSVRRGRMTAEDVGNLREAPEARISSRQWSPAQQAIAMELRLFRLVKAGRVDEARRAWAKPSFRLQGARVTARYFAAGLALGLVEPDVGYDSMLNALAVVRPWQARLSPLDPFRHFTGEPVGISSQLQKRFIGLFPTSEEADPDFPFQALALADALRYGGGNEGAAYLLKEALKRAPAEWVGTRRLLILAAQRLELILPDTTLWDFLHAADDEYAAFQTVARVEQAEWWQKRGQSNQVAEALLKCDPGAVAGSQYEMRYYVVQAPMLSDRAAANAYSRAAQLASELGWRPPQPPSRTVARAVVPDGPARPSLYPRRRIVSIRAEPETGPPAHLVITIEDPRVKPSVGRLDLKQDPRLRDVLASNSRTAAADYLDDLEPALERMKKVLPDPLGQPLRGQSPGDVAIVTPPGPLAGLPCEAAAERSGIRFLFRQPYSGENPRDSVVWLQRWLDGNGFPVTVDGVAGPQTLEMLSRAEKQLGVLVDGWDGFETRKRMCPPDLKQASVILLQSSVLEQHTRDRGYGAYGLSLDRVYRERNLFTRHVEVDISFLDRMASEIKNPGRRLFHITLDLVDAREGAALRTKGPDGSDNINVGRRGYAGFAEAEITATRLGSLLDDGKGLPGAFVILDPPHPGNPREWARQLVLRNQFAHELLATRCVWGVLATGLTGPDRERVEWQMNRLVTRIVSRPCAGELARVCDRFSSLFCWDPTLPVW